MILNIRKATTEDSKPLLKLLEEARKYKVSLGDLAWGDYPFTQDDIELRLKSNSCYVAELDDKTVGSITLIWEDEHNWGPKGLDGQAGYVHGLMVSNESRGHGIGAHMLEWAAREVKNKGRTYLRLDCPASNEGLPKYYESLGFTQVDTGANASYCHYERVVK